MRGDIELTRGPPSPPPLGKTLLTATDAVYFVKIQIRVSYLRVVVIVFGLTETQLVIHL